MTEQPAAGDVIGLREMRFMARHGVFPEEKITAGPFVVDIELYSDLAEAGRMDDLERTVDYRKAYEAVREVLLGETRNLLETLAEDVAGRLLERLPIRKVGVTVAKLSPPLPGSVGRAEVRIERTSGGIGEGAVE